MNQKLKYLGFLVLGLLIGLSSFAIGQITQTGPDQITICHTINNATTYLYNSAFALKGPSSLNLTLNQKAALLNNAETNRLKTLYTVGQRRLEIYLDTNGTGVN